MSGRGTERVIQEGEDARALVLEAEVAALSAFYVDTAQALERADAEGRRLLDEAWRLHRLTDPCPDGCESLCSCSTERERADLHALETGPFYGVAVLWDAMHAAAAALEI